MAVQLGDILRVAVKFLFNNADDIVNVWHMVFDDLGTTADDGDAMVALGSMFDAWYTQAAGAHSTLLTGAEVTGVNVTKNELLPLITFTFAGTSAAEGSPLQASPMLQFHSATPRHGGRIYLPPFTEATMSSGVIQAGTVTTLQDMAADVLAGFTEVTFGTAAHRISYERATGTPRDLITAVVPTVVRTQRRRRQGVGA